MNWKTFRNEVTKRDIELLIKHVPRINKKLKHLLVLANTDEHSLSDLARVVIWSLIAGVPYVSFHDITGQLKLQEEKFFLEVELNKKGVPGCIKWSKKPDLNGYSNGSQAPTIIVHIFTHKDGRETITKCVQQIAEERIVCERQKSNEYTVQEFDQALMLLYPSIPDIDLVLYTGPLCITYGVLPWQIRLSEFIQLSLDHSVNIENYIGALYRYSKCDMRFGT